MTSDFRELTNLLHLLAEITCIIEFCVAFVFKL